MFVCFTLSIWLIYVKLIFYANREKIYITKLAQCLYKIHCCGTGTGTGTVGTVTF